MADDVEGMAASLSEGKVLQRRLLRAAPGQRRRHSSRSAAPRWRRPPTRWTGSATSSSTRTPPCAWPTSASGRDAGGGAARADGLRRPPGAPREPELLKEKRGLPALIERAVERVGLLGHNVIFARSLVLREGDVDGPRFEHARAQLARNVERSDDEFTSDRVQQVTALTPDSVPQVGLPHLVAAGDEETAVGAVRGYVAEGADVQDLIDGLVLAFCAVDVRQPHYLIFPESVQFLSECMAPRCRELALVQLARMACGAAREYGTSAPCGGRRHIGGKQRPPAQPEPPDHVYQPLPAPARLQPRGLVSLGRGGPGARPPRGPAHLPEHRLRRLPLVPRDGAGVLRGPRDRAAAERELRLHQGRP